ncbi:PDZ/DHR/GLGF domain protein [Trichostrongylus colubriformis]|uniref:PDZ/DHR/GLGF domain protein n=1 Tax=Trichostrongylus colubriformis TaxID=6319 RepID=A0AAN8IUG9_TRICO
MFDSTSCSSTPFMRSRPFSAYSNLCCAEEDEGIDESQLVDWQIHSKDNSCEIEINIHREKSRPGGLAFRIIGSRSSGIFVSYVDESSEQANFLREGDLIKECNGRNMSGITCAQVSHLAQIMMIEAASILRFSLFHSAVLCLRIARKGSGPLLMARRRTLAQISQEREKLYRLSATRCEFTRPCQTRVRQSTSCPDYRPFSTLPVKVTVFNAKLVRKVASVDEEIELLMENEERSAIEPTM